MDGGVVLSDVEVEHADADKIGAVAKCILESATRIDGAGREHFEGNPRLGQFFHDHGRGIAGCLLLFQSGDPVPQFLLVTLDVRVGKCDVGLACPEDIASHPANLTTERH